MKLPLLSLILFCFVGMIGQAFSQESDPVLFRINEYEVHLSEFAEVYRKNNLEMAVADPPSVEEYLELFIHFKLKVMEARTLGLDTNPSFISELAGYREQLARPYFYDQQVNDQLLQEAYQRMLFDIRASHILIALDEHAAPADTLRAYLRAMEIYQRLNGNESFDVVARELSEDPSARDRAATAQSPGYRGNSGDLGYFTVFNMVYPFESAAYNTPVGQVSLPVRSPFGYHLVKVTDRLPAIGRVRAAHIMINSPLGTPPAEEETNMQKINELHQRLLQGEDFGTLAAQFSQDGASAARNGQLPEFTSSRMVPQFIKAISQLQEPGDFSPPVKTDFGWHIVMLLDRKAPASFEEEYFELRNRVSRDSRSRLSRDVVLQRLKNEYDFKEQSNNLEVFFQLVDASVFEGRWDAKVAMEHDKPLFSFAGKTLTQRDFTKHLDLVQGMRTPESIPAYVRSVYNNWVEQSLIAFEDSLLEEKHPEFGSIMKEYHEGILLFELTDKLVWSRAVEDTLGLVEFFANHSDQYMWEERLNASIYICRDEKTASRVRNAQNRANRRGSDLMQYLKVESLTDISVKSGLFERGQDQLIDHIEWKPGWTKPFPWNGNFVVVNVQEVIPAQPKAMDEIRGLLIADYQNYLEKQWVEQLKDKYHIEVNKELLGRLVF